IVNRIERHAAPVIWLALDEHLVRMKVWPAEGEVFLSLLRHDQRERDDIAFAFVELIDGPVDTRGHFYFQTDIEMFCKKVQELILVAHRLPLVNKIAYRIVVDERIDVAPRNDLLQIDRHFR